MRGYFGIGVEGIHKGQNLGNLVRSAHAFGASFFFTIAPCIEEDVLKVSDTADSFDHVPYYEYPSVEAFELPKNCALVAVEFVDESINLPSFRHPTRAAYILGPEMGNVSPALLKRCDHIVKIPTKFCINVGVAGALVMYDRAISMGHFSGGRFSARPVRPGGPDQEFDEKAFGDRRRLRGKK